MLVRVSRPKSAASGVLQRGHYPHPHSRHAGAAAGILSRVCVSSATPRGEEGGADIRQTSGEGSLGALTPSNSYTAPPGDKLVVLGHRHRGHVDNVRHRSTGAPPILTRAAHEGSRRFHNHREGIY